MIDCLLKNNTKEKEMSEKILDLDDDSDETVLDATDFGFIVSSSGELKSLMYPEGLEGDPPEEVILILEILGIDLTAPSSSRTLH
jgi:hypothetical protein